MALHKCCKWRHPVLAIILLQFSSAEEDIKTVLRRAADQYAGIHGTSIETRALASGMCFARYDYTENKDKCVDQPSGIEFERC